MSDRYDPNTVVPVVEKGILLDKSLERKMLSLLTDVPEKTKPRWLLSAIKTTNEIPKFNVMPDSYIDKEANNSDTIVLYGYSNVVQKPAPSITSPAPTGNKLFKPLQIILENNHNAGQLIDLFAQGIGMKEINILDMIDEKTKAVNRTKFVTCQPLGFQFYGNFMVMYYSYRKIEETINKQKKSGGIAGKISGLLGLGEDK